MEQATSGLMPSHDHSGWGKYVISR